MADTIGNIRQRIVSTPYNNGTIKCFIANMNSNIDIIQNFYRYRSFHRIIIQGVCRNKHSNIPIIFKCWNRFGRLPDKGAFNISTSSSKFRRSQCLPVYNIACRRILGYYRRCLFNGKCLCSRTAVVSL